MTWLALVLLPGLALCLVAWIRQAPWTDEQSISGHVFRTRTRHARFLPKESLHSFAYPGLYLGVDLETLERGGLDRGRIFKWQHPQKWSLLSMRSSGYLTAFGRGDAPGIRERLLLELERHGVDKTRVTRVYTISMPAYGSFEGINPLVVHFVYSSGCELAVVVLEVHNTFEERHVYVLQCGIKEDEKVAIGFEHQWTFPRSFHVSPFNDRSGFYRVSVSDPLRGKHTEEALPEQAQIDIKIVLLTGDTVPQKKLMATLEGVGVPMTGTNLLKTVAALPVSLLLTTPRILYEAFKLHYRKKLDVFPRPEPYTGQKGGETNPVAAETVVGSVYWQQAVAADVYARGVVEKELSTRCAANEICVELMPEDRSLAVQSFGTEKDPKLVIGYASPLLFSDLLLAPSLDDAVALSDGRWAVSSSQLFAKLFQPRSDRPLSRAAGMARTIRRAHMRWLQSFAPTVKLDKMPERHPFDDAADSALVSHLFWRAFNELLGYYIFRVLGARFVAGTEPWTVLTRTHDMATKLKTLGNGIGSAWTFSSAQYARARQSRVGKTTAFLLKYRKTVLFTTGSLYVFVQIQRAKAFAKKRDEVLPGTVLVWKIHDGSIVEQRSNTSTLSLLLQSKGDSSEEPPRIMTLWEVIQALKCAAADERITGIVADFSHESLPTVPAYILGLAQIEELVEAICAPSPLLGVAQLDCAPAVELKTAKREQLGDKFQMAAFADTFASQGTFALASAFDKIYVQPSGEVPFTGVSATLPFFAKLLTWLGIDMHAEARTAYKSVVAPYTSEELSPAQRANEEELLRDLHHNLCSIIAYNRFGEGSEHVEKVKELAFRGPFSSAEAVETGLVDGVKYRKDVLRTLFDEGRSVEEETGEISYPIRGFYHYAQTMAQLLEKAAVALDVGVVYLLSEIDLGGNEFGTSSVLKGLKEAGADDSIGAVILRIDSGGGGVVPSDTIHNAVRELQDKGKIVIASFSNAAASGAYLISTHADAILASPSTITGSIGVAALRPTVTPRLLDRVKLTAESFFNGSKYESLLHPLEGEDLARFRNHVDLHYADFKDRVCDGRAISKDVIDLVAGGRVFTGSKALTLNPPASGTLGQAQTPAEEVAKPSLGVPLPAVLLEMFEKSFGQSRLASIPALGRGLVDALGGLGAASVLAAEMQLSRAVEATLLENPGWTPQEALDEVAPDLPRVEKEDGTMQVELAVNLKRFPAEKTFLATLVEQSQRGDGIDPSAVSMTIRAAIVSMLAPFVAREMDALGLRQALAPLLEPRRSSRFRLEEPLARRIRL